MDNLHLWQIGIDVSQIQIYQSCVHYIVSNKEQKFRKQKIKLYQEFQNLIQKSTP